MKKRMVLLDVYNNEVKDVEIDGLEDMYEAIGCDLVEMPTRKIGKNYYTIICDEEGTFRENVRISAIDDFGNVMLVGNMLITSAEITEDGELTGLTEEQAKEIKKHIKVMCTKNIPSGYKMLTQVAY